ncbi:MAG: hypothetical protein RJA24_1322, partial [Pseudomonadota bacterium]
MQITRIRRWQILAQSSVFVLLLALLVALLAYFSREYRVEYDLTHGARNTLSATTIGALKQLQGPISVKAYAIRQDSSGSNVHKTIEERLRAYQRAKPDLQLQLIDPREQPKLAAEAGLRTPNALVIEYQRRTEQIPLADFSEQSFANALLRLARGSNSLVLWLDGHGERKLDGLANHDLGAFGHRLREKGFNISNLNLALAQ